MQRVFVYSHGIFSSFRVASGFRHFSERYLHAKFRTRPWKSTTSNFSLTSFTLFIQVSTLCLANQTVCLPRPSHSRISMTILIRWRLGRPSLEYGCGFHR